MTNPFLVASAFCPLRAMITNRSEWDRRLKRDMDTLHSLANLDFKTKCYFDERDGKFYPSTWTIGENMKRWIGVWAAEQVAKGEEVCYRSLWKIKVQDTVTGIKTAQQQIITTLAIASRSIDQCDQGGVIDLSSLEQQIRRIRETSIRAFWGLDRLKGTYVSDSSKFNTIYPIVNDFCREIKNFAEEVLNQVETRQQYLHELRSPPVPIRHLRNEHNSWSLPKGENGGEMESKPTLPAQDSVSTNTSNSPPPLRDPIPFYKPKNAEQRLFNQKSSSQFQVMSQYLLRQLGVFREWGKSIQGSYFRVKKGLTHPWSSLITPEGRIYSHYHMSIVPKGEGGCYKKDKRGYSWEQGCDIAKLSTKITEPKEMAVAKNEEKFLKICTQKKLPHVAMTYDVIWIHKRGILQQIIYQKFYAHGSLEDSLQRLKGEKEKLKQIMLGVLKGLVALHAEKIVHRDLKPGNIFLDENDIPHIGDLGLSCEQGEQFLDHPGSPYFLDPMIVKSGRSDIADFAQDVWAFGMLMYGLLKDPTSECPWPWLTTADTASDVNRLNTTQKSTSFPEPTKSDLWMYTCWEALLLDRKIRPTAPQLLARLETS